MVQVCMLSKWSLKSVAFLLTVMLCWAFPAFSESVKPRHLNLEQALLMAMQNNPKLNAERSRLEVTQAAIQTAGTRPNPSIISDNGIGEKTYRLGIWKEFELGGKRQRRLDLAGAELRATQAEINTQRLKTRAEVRKAYTQLYNAQQRQRAYEYALGAMQELLVSAKIREKANEQIEMDLLQAQIIQSNTNNDLQLAALELEQSKIQLNALLNQPLTQDLVLDPPTVAPRLSPGQVSAGSLLNEPVLIGRVEDRLELSTEELIQQANNHRPDLRAAIVQEEVGQKQVALAKIRRIPNVRLAAGPDWVTGPGGVVGAFIMGDMELPVLNQHQGEIQEALARQSQLRQEELALKHRIALEVTQAAIAVKAQQQRVQRFEAEVLPYGEMLARKSITAFQTGKLSVLSTINAQHFYMGSLAGYFRALMDYQDAISDLEWAVGSDN